MIKSEEKYTPICTVGDVTIERIQNIVSMIQSTQPNGSFSTKALERERERECTRNTGTASKRQAAKVKAIQ